MNIKRLTIAAVICTLFATGLRIAQFEFFYNKETGFFTDNGLLSLIGILTALGLAGVTAFRVRGRYGEICHKKNSLAGISLALGGVINLYSAYFMYQGYKLLQESGFQEVSATGLSMRMPFIVATGILGVVFFICAFGYFTDTKFFQSFPIVHLLAVVWSLILILFVFIHYSVSILLTENVYVIFSACAIALSFLDISKFVSGVNRQGRGIQNTLVTAVLAFVLIMSYCLSSFVNIILGNITPNEPPLELVLILFSTALYISVFLGTLTYRAVEAPAKENMGKRFKIHK